MTPPAGERGSATVLILALSSVLALLGMVSVALGAVAVTRHRAASAADLAALAAADRSALGPSAACHAADRAATAVAARLEHCQLIAPQESGRVATVAEVVVSVQPPGPLSSLGSARAIARAGPCGPNRECG